MFSVWTTNFVKKKKIIVVVVAIAVLVIVVLVVVEVKFRKPKNELIHKYVLYTPRKSHGERKKGRPQLQFADYIGKLINSDIQLTVDEIRAMANDRKLWATKVVGVCKPKVFAVD